MKTLTVLLLCIASVVAQAQSLFLNQMIYDPAGKSYIHFANDVAVSGEWAVVGDPMKKIGANTNKGEILFYHKDPASWILDQSLTIDGGTGIPSHQGASVDISGTTAFATVVDGTESGPMHVEVINYDGTNWNVTQELSNGCAAGAICGSFGTGLDISELGNWAMIGDYTEKKVYIYHQSGGVWSLYQTLTRFGDGAQYYYGVNCYIDDEYAVVGCGDIDINTNGCAYIYHFDGAIWQNEQRIVSADAAVQNMFGAAIIRHGEQLFIGTPGYDSDGGAFSANGEVNVFTRSGITWNQTQTILSPVGFESWHFGTSLAFSGEQLFIGAIDDYNPATNSRGQVYSLSNIAGAWTIVQNIENTGSPDQETYGKVISASGENLIVGAPNKKVNKPGQGAAWFYQFELGCVAPPAPTITNITATTAKVNWQTVVPAASYKVHYRPSGTLTWTTKNATVNSLKIKMLTPATSYDCQVAPVCDGITGTWSNTTVFTTGVLKLSGADEISNEIIIYPDPADQFIMVSSDEEIKQYVVVDLTGNIILNKTIEHAEQFQIDVSTLPAGFYFIQMENVSGLMQTRSFIKN